MSTLLDVTGLQIKTAMIYCFIPLRRAKVTKWIIMSPGKNKGRHSGNSHFRRQSGRFETN